MLFKIMSWGGSHPFTKVARASDMTAALNVAKWASVGDEKRMEISVIDKTDCPVCGTLMVLGDDGLVCETCSARLS